MSSGTHATSGLCAAPKAGDSASRTAHHSSPLLLAGWERSQPQQQRTPRPGRGGLILQVAEDEDKDTGNQKKEAVTPSGVSTVRGYTWNPQGPERLLLKVLVSSASEPHECRCSPFLLYTKNTTRHPETKDSPVPRGRPLPRAARSAVFHAAGRRPSPGVGPSVMARLAHVPAAADEVSVAGRARFGGEKTSRHKPAAEPAEREAPAGGGRVRLSSPVARLPRGSAPPRAQAARRSLGTVASLPNIFLPGLQACVGVSQALRRACCCVHGQQGGPCSGNAGHSEVRVDKAPQARSRLSANSW